MFYKTCSRL